MLCTSVNTKLNYYLGHKIDKNSTPFLLGYERLINMLPTWRKVSFLVKQNFAEWLRISKCLFFFLLKVIGNNIKRAAKKLLKLISKFIEALMRDTFLPQGIV